MADYKVTYIFNSKRYGWTETWYMTADSVQQALQGATGKVLTTRQALLGQFAHVDAVRVSDDLLPGDSLLQFATSQWQPDLNADTPWNAICLRAEAGPFRRRQVWLRGFPDEWIDWGPQADVGNASVLPDGRKAIQAWWAQVIAPPVFKLKAINKSSQGSLGVPVTGLVAQVGGPYTVFTAAAFAGVAGEKVGMKGWKGPDRGKLNKTYRVVAVTPTTVTVDVPYVLLTDPAANFAGRLYPKSYLFYDLSTYSIVGPKKRSTGRSFFVSRGRRQTRK